MAKLPWWIKHSGMIKGDDNKMTLNFSISKIGYMYLYLKAFISILKTVRFTKAR